jgi:hypothetical protein
LWQKNVFQKTENKDSPVSQNVLPVCSLRVWCGARCSAGCGVYSHGDWVFFVFWQQGFLDKNAIISECYRDFLNNSFRMWCVSALTFCISLKMLIIFCLQALALKVSLNFQEITSNSRFFHPNGIFL